MELAHDAESVSRARHSLGALGDDVSSQTLETLVLLVSELVTNAVLHADLGLDERIGLKVGSYPGVVRAEVHDGGPGFYAVPPRQPEPEQIGGRGLYLVQTLSDRWGVDQEDLVVVCFEVDHGK